MLRAPRLTHAQNVRLVEIVLRTLLLLPLAICQASDINVTVTDFPNKLSWRSANSNTSYWALKSTAPFLQASQLCQQDGGVLWSITDQQEQSRVHTMLGGSFWIGLKSSADGAWWQDQGLYDDSLFTSTVQNTSKAWCAAVAYPVRPPVEGDSASSKWLYAMDCSALNQFLCSFNKTTTPASNLTTLGKIYDVGDQLIVAVGRTLKWTDAHAVCRRSGGQLLSLSTLSVQQRVKALPLPSPVRQLTDVAVDGVGNTTTTLSDSGGDNGVLTADAAVSVAQVDRFWLGIEENSCLQVGFEEGVKCSWTGGRGMSVWDLTLPSGQLYQDVFADDGRQQLCVSVSVTDLTWRAREACESRLTVVCQADHHGFDGVRQQYKNWQYIFFSRPASYSTAKYVCGQANSSLVENAGSTELTYITGQAGVLMRSQAVQMGVVAFKSRRVGTSGVDQLCSVAGVMDSSGGYMMPGVVARASCEDEYAFVCKRENKVSAPMTPRAIIAPGNTTANTSAAAAPAEEKRRKTGADTAAIFGICASAGVVLACLVCIVIRGITLLHRKPDSPDAPDPHHQQRAHATFAPQKYIHQTPTRPKRTRYRSARHPNTQPPYAGHSRTPPPTLPHTYARPATATTIGTTSTAATGGTAGTAGTPGTTGTAGTPGTTGTAGTPGTTGTAGTAGTTGTAGTPGTARTSGTIGTPGSTRTRDRQRFKPLQTASTGRSASDRILHASWQSFASIDIAPLTSPTHTFSALNAADVISTASSASIDDIVEEEILHVVMDLDPDHDIKIFRDKKLGHGGFGSVYLGEYQGIPVAVKTLDMLSMNLVSETTLGFSGYANQELAAIKQELSILSQVQHPNVVKLFGGCLTPPKVMIVMELMDCSLADYMLRAKGPLPLRTTLQMIRAVAAGIAHLHPDIIHRDLKPQNILLDSKGNVKITDFGVSRIKKSTTLNTEHHAAGTIPYMAPECYQAHKVTEKCDIYSLGIILWQCLTGKLPWEGWNGMAIMYHVGCLQARPLTEDISGCPPAVSQLIARCWAHFPDSRPTAHEIVEELNSIEASTYHLTAPAPVAE